MAERGGGERRIDRLFIHRVPGLVQRRKQRVAEVVFTHAGRDAHIARGEFRAERMVREIEPATLEVVAQALGRPFGEFQLLRRPR